MTNSLTNIVSPIYQLIKDQLIGQSINRPIDQSINQSRYCIRPFEYFYFSYASSWDSLRLTDFISGLDSSKPVNKIQHIAADPQTPGNIIFADSHALFTTDGKTVSLIAGSFGTQSGFQEGVGIRARFSKINSFVVVSKSLLIVVDEGNRCLIQVNLVTKQTQQFSGLCGSTTAETIDGDKDTARFGNMVSIDIDRTISIGDLFVLDNNVKYYGRSVDIKTGAVTTQLEDDKATSTALDFIQPSCGSYMVIISEYQGGEGGGKRFVLYNNNIVYYEDIPVTFSKLIDIGNFSALSAVPAFSSVLFTSSFNNAEFPICSGTQGNVNGDLSSCQLDTPHALLHHDGKLFMSVATGIKKIDSK